MSEVVHTLFEGQASTGAAQPERFRSELQAVVHKQANQLFDVLALLHAVEAMLNNHPSYDDEPIHNTLRVAQMARERLTGVMDALNQHI
jgi:hypothetical protein